jgi:chromosome segregation ATPase
MDESSADWLREHMRQHIANPVVIESTDNVLDFRSPSYFPKNQGAAALALVNQAADLIEDIDHRATERHARAKALAEKAIEKLKIADDRACFAESARQAAETELREYKDRLEKLSTKLQEIEKVADDRVRSAESARHAAETELREYKDRLEKLSTKLQEIEKVADDRVRCAESARHAAETELKEYRDSVKRLTAKVEEIEKAMERAAIRSVAVQAELTAAEQRAINAEIRANEAENALKRIEAAIRTQILEKNLNDSGRNAVRAA